MLALTNNFMFHFPCVVLHFSCDAMLRLSCDAMLHFSRDAMLHLSCDAMFHFSRDASGFRSIHFNWIHSAACAPFSNWHRGTLGVLFFETFFLETNNGSRLKVETKSCQNM